MPDLPQNGLKVPSNIKFVPTANVLDYGQDLALHLTSVGFTEKSVTFSSAAITRSLDEDGQPLDAIPHVYSDTDTGLILHEGNNTSFNTDYVFESDMPAVVYKTSINVCMGLSVSAYSSGNFNLGNLIATTIALDGTITITGCPAATEIFLDDVSAGTYSSGTLTLTGSMSGSFQLKFVKDKYYDTYQQIIVSRKT